MRKPRFPQHHRNAVTLTVLALLSCAALSGCSYFMALGLLIGGPPTVEPEFDKQTKKSMTDKDVKVVVVCFAPNEVRYSFENIDREVALYVSKRLNEHKITTIETDYVNAWLDQNKEWVKPTEIGAAFKATYVVYIDINRFTLYEEGSATLYRGHSESIVSVWEMDDSGDGERIFSAEKICRYPKFQPTSTSDVTFPRFKAEYLSKLSDDIGRFFYEYSLTDEIGAN